MEREYLFLAYTSQVNSGFSRNLISSSISQYPALFNSDENNIASSFVQVTRRRTFISINEVALPKNTKKRKKFGNKVFKDMSFHFLVINALRMC